MGAASRALELTEAIHTSCPTHISTTWTREETEISPEDDPFSDRR